MLKRLFLAAYWLFVYLRASSAASPIAKKGLKTMQQLNGAVNFVETPNSSVHPWCLRENNVDGKYRDLDYIPTDEVIFDVVELKVIKSIENSQNDLELDSLSHRKSHIVGRLKPRIESKDNTFFERRYSFFGTERLIEDLCITISESESESMELKDHSYSVNCQEMTEGSGSDENFAKDYIEVKAELNSIVFDETIQSIEHGVSSGFIYLKFLDGFYMPYRESKIALDSAWIKEKITIKVLSIPEQQIKKMLKNNTFVPKSVGRIGKFDLYVKDPPNSQNIFGHVNYIDYRHIETILKNLRELMKNPAIPLWIAAIALVISLFR